MLCVGGGDFSVAWSTVWHRRHAKFHDPVPFVFCPQNATTCHHAQAGPRFWVDEKFDGLLPFEWRDTDICSNP